MANALVKDEKYQHKLALQELMECNGMRVLKADISDDVAYVQAQLDVKGFVNDSKLAKFNYDLGMKAGLEMVLNRLAGYEDELVGDDVKPPKK